MNWITRVAQVLKRLASSAWSVSISKGGKIVVSFTKRF